MYCHDCALHLQYTHLCQLSQIFWESSGYRLNLPVSLTDKKNHLDMKKSTPHTFKTYFGIFGGKFLQYLTHFVWELYFIKVFLGSRRLNQQSPRFQLFHVSIIVYMYFFLHINYVSIRNLNFNIGYIAASKALPAFNIIVITYFCDSYALSRK